MRWRRRKKKCKGRKRGGREEDGEGITNKGKENEKENKLRKYYCSPMLFSYQ
jgi:ribosome assembly protein YihI (activator of Der GTPase)